MKPLKICFILCILVSLMIGSCEFFLDDKKCEDWKPWDTRIHITYSLQCIEVGPGLERNILDALDLKFIGTIRNIDCTGYEEDYYDINSTVFPSFLFPNYHVRGFYPVNVSSVDFPFEITNYHEYFTVSFTMEATFADGLVLKSNEVTQKTGDAQWLKTDSYLYHFEVYAIELTWTVVNT